MNVQYSEWAVFCANRTPSLWGAFLAGFMSRMSCFSVPPEMWESGCIFTCDCSYRYLVYHNFGIWKGILILNGCIHSRSQSRLYFSKYWECDCRIRFRCCRIAKVHVTSAAQRYVFLQIASITSDYRFHNSQWTWLLPVQGRNLLWHDLKLTGSQCRRFVCVSRGLRNSRQLAAPLTTTQRYSGQARWPLYPS